MLETVLVQMTINKIKIPVLAICITLAFTACFPTATNDYPYTKEVNISKSEIEHFEKKIMLHGKKWALIVEYSDNFIFKNEDVHFWGVDADSPNMILLALQFRNEKFIVDIPPAAINRLANVHLSSIKLEAENGITTIKIRGGDAGSGYYCELCVEEGVLVKRYVTSAGGGVNEESKWQNGKPVYVKYSNEYLNIHQEFRTQSSHRM